MLTCIVRPVINKKFINFDITEFTKLSEALPGVVIELELDVNLKKIDPSKLLGSGNIDHLKTIIHQKKIKLLLVDFELSPIQQRNLEKELNTKILDRTGLILEIFSSRALSKEGVLQVELAHLSWQKSRLVRSWTHLERQRGGFGFLGGQFAVGRFRGIGWIDMVRQGKLAISSDIVKHDLQRYLTNFGLNRKDHVVKPNFTSHITLRKYQKKWKAERNARKEWAEEDDEFECLVADYLVSISCTCNCRV